LRERFRAPLFCSLGLDRFRLKIVLAERIIPLPQGLLPTILRFL
jgi:hypothetical protein